MRKFLWGLLFILISHSSFSQNFSNKGKDFWVGYGYHQIMNSTNVQNMVLYFATDQVTTVTVSIPGTGSSVTYANIPANTVFTSNPLPKNGVNDARLLQESTLPENKGIHIVADKPIVAYAHIYNTSVSGATILFPTNTLGKEYYSINYTNTSNTGDANCWFYVIAADTGTTTVEITPSASTIYHPAGVPFTVTLTQGQVYNFMGQLTGGGGGAFSGVDLTGSKIRSVASASGACKRIAVFSGSGRISITCNGNAASSDNYMVQAMPKSAWGKEFLTTPTGGLPNNIFRVCVSDPTANVLLNGAPIPYTLINNFYYEIPATRQPLKIESDLPITVAQYITSNSNCGNPNNSLGDPEVIYLSPVEQNISKVIWSATSNFAITSHYYSVVIPNTGTAISSFRLDGVPVNPALFNTHPGDAGYSYLTQNVGAGQRMIESDSGFNAIAYGYGANESYGYNAGTNVRDLLQQIGVSSPFAIEEGPSICVGSSFKFKVSLPYLVDSMRWNLSSLPGSPASPLITYSSPPVPGDADSTTIINGKTVYWYSLPSFYNFNTVGVFPVTITAYAATAEGCGNEQEISFDLEVTAPPVPAFDYTHNGCVDQPVQFTDQTTSTKPTYSWWWDFNDPASGANNNSILKNPGHTFSGPGTYRVRFATITTPGCVSDTIFRDIVIHPLPVGNIAGDVIVCQNQPAPNIVFTGTTGTAPFSFTYNINNGPAQTIVSTTGNSVSLPVPTGTVGDFAYHLVSIRDAAGTNGCIQPMPDTVRVTVNPLASATIAGSTSVCMGAAAPVVSFTAAGGSVPPFTFSYDINGGPVQTISTVTGNSVSLPVPTAAVGTFHYNLLSVRDASVTACSQLQSGTATIVVNPLPTATISGTTGVCINGASPSVTFTGAGTTAPYTFTYNINGGAPQTVTSTGNTAILTVPTATAGSFIYNLVSVQDGSSTACARPQTGAATVTVHPLPTASFTVSTPTCVSRTISFSSTSTANVGTIATYAWNFDDIGSGANNSSTLANPTHVFANAGTYTVTLIVTNSENCTSTMAQQTITIGTLPTADFSMPEVCLLDPVTQFTDLSSAINPATVTGWQWNFGDPASGANNVSTQQNGQHSYTAVGNYPVRLIVTTNAGCTDTSAIQMLTVNGGNPVSNFVQLNALTSCSSDTVSIQNKSTIASGSITKVEIHWDNTNQPAIFETDENPVFDKIYKYKYPTSTNTINYSVRFRAYSGGVCVSDRILPVTALATPNVAMATIPDQCYSSTPSILSYGSETGGVVGTASYSGPGVSFNGTNWVFNSSVAGIGSHQIQYKFTSTAGGCTDSIPGNVRVLDTATARFTLQTPACEKNTVTFTEQSSAPSTVTLASTVWDFGDGSAPVTYPAGATITHTYGAAGTYTVNMYNVAAVTGCLSSTYSYPVVINPIPAPNFGFPASLCLPAANAVFADASTIADGTENAFTYLWNFGDPASGTANTATVKDPTHIYTGTGPYNVNLQVTSGAGCVHDTTIVLNTIHPQPKASFAVSRPAICLGDNVSFTSLSSGGDGTITSWNWNFDDGSPEIAATDPTHLYTSARSYSVKHFITNSFGCNSDTAVNNVKVYAPPTVNAGPDLFVLEGGSASLEPSFNAEDPIFLWTPSDYLNSTTVARPVTTPLLDITYTITISNPGGCSTADSVFVKILKGPKIPNIFSPNGDGVNDRWVIEYLDTYPNCKVVVFTRTGQKVFESRGYKVPWNGTMNGKPLPLDTYYYIIEPENGRKPVTGYVTIVK